MKKPKYLHDGIFQVRKNESEHYVRAWREGRGRNSELVVHTWLNKTSPDGEPDGEWGMPGLLPVDVAIEQAILNGKS